LPPEIEGRPGYLGPEHSGKGTKNGEALWIVPNENHFSWLPAKQVVGEVK